MVLNGDAQDEELLIEENIDSTDVFVALTNSEEANLLSAMLAKRLGAHKVMALVNKPSYGELMENRSIDIVISPQTVTIGSLLAHVRRATSCACTPCAAAQPRRSRRSCTVRMTVARDRPQRRGDRDAGRRLDRAIVRGEKVLIAHHDTRIESEDHVIVFLADRRHVEAVERLFQAG